jgi:hypothetical protein
MTRISARVAPHPRAEGRPGALATERYGTTPDPRPRKVATSLVKHLHAFIREIEATGLIVDFAEHGPGVASNGERMSVPYLTASYDFILAPAAAAPRSAA